MSKTSSRSIKRGRLRDERKKNTNAPVSSGQPVMFCIRTYPDLAQTWRNAELFHEWKHLEEGAELRAVREVWLVTARAGVL